MSLCRHISACLLVGIALLSSSCSLFGNPSKNHISRFMHVNINCSDLEQSRSFYNVLGFTTVMSGDSTVGAEFSVALDMDPYVLSYAQMLSGDGLLIDLIEWKDPFDSAAPYADANHLGIARLTLTTEDLDADIAALRALDAEFLSEPVAIVTAPGGERFVCLKDPDGTILELVEESTGRKGVSINCSDLEASRLFYKKLGFASELHVEETATPEMATALGMPSYQVRGALMSLKAGATAIRLLEWEDPFDISPPYAQLNHLGIPRIALMSTHLDSDVTRLKAEGFEFMSDPVVPGGLLAFLRIVCLKDPDGTVIELVELFPGFRF